jgi:hypothetical protein
VEVNHLLKSEIDMTIHSDDDGINFSCYSGFNATGMFSTMNKVHKQEGGD